MTNSQPLTTAADHQPDHWPTFALGPTDYELAVTDIAKSMDLQITDWQVQHLEPVEGLEGSFDIDVTARFRLAGMDFLILFECKRHSSAVKRDHVLALHAKLQSVGAQKGVIVAASGFQSGALQYARAHSIACVRLIDNAWTYLTRSQSPQLPPALTGVYSGYVITANDDGDYDSALLTGHPANTRAAIIGTI
jgi:hypothetical protein